VLTRWKFRRKTNEGDFGREKKTTEGTEKVNDYGEVFSDKSGADPVEIQEKDE